MTGNGLAAGCQLFYRKIYGHFYSVEISLVLLLNKMIDSLVMYLSAARDYSFLRDSHKRDFVLQAFPLFFQRLSYHSCTCS